MFCFNHSDTGWSDGARFQVFLSVKTHLLNKNGKSNFYCWIRAITNELLRNLHGYFTHLESAMECSPMSVKFVLK